MTARVKQALLIAITTPLLMQVVFAHGGLEHVLGTVVDASPASITVKTSEGKTVKVNVDAKTQFTRAGANIAAQDVKPGDRVVIHAKKDGDTLLAHTVQIGVAKGH